MRDITKDLKQRLAEVEIEIGKLQKQLDDLIFNQRSIKALIATEENRWRVQASLPGLAPPSREKMVVPPISQFILSSLRNGEKPLKVLIKEARENNIPIKAKKPGRAIHFALVGLSKRGLTEKRDGVWRLKSINTATMTGLTEDLRASNPPTHPA